MEMFGDPDANSSREAKLTRDRFTIGIRFA
jgi:hypothetical protein